MVSSFETNGKPACGPPTPTHTWHARTLGGEIPPEEPPSLLLSLFYPTGRNLLYGETGCMKTWVALCAAAEVLWAGRAVLWIDYELTQRAVAKRLVALGCTSEERSRFHYCRPSEALAGEGMVYVLTLLKEQDPGLAVVDAFSGALGAACLDDNKNGDVECWWQRDGLVLWGNGARCLLVLDHVNKSEQNRSRYPSGSKRKLEAADLAYQVEAKKQMGRNPPQNGVLALVTTKDREGHAPRKPGNLELRPDAQGGITWQKYPDLPNEAAEAPFRPTCLMERVSRAVEQAGDDGLSRNQTERQVEGKAAAVRTAIDVLVAEGHLVEEAGPRKAKILRPSQAYRQANDPLSSDFVPPRPHFVRDEVNRPRPTSSHPLQGGRSGDEDEVARVEETTSSHNWIPEIEP